jgi:hypothetical protein
MHSSNFIFLQVSSFSFGSLTLADPIDARTDTGVLGIAIPLYDPPSSFLKRHSLTITFSDTYFDILKAYNGSLPNDNSAIDGSLAFNSSIVPSLPSLNITLGSEVFSIPPSRYIVPRSLYSMLNVTDIPGLERTWIESAGPGAFNLGQKWLENFYTAYDSKLLFFFFFSLLAYNEPLL